MGVTSVLLRLLLICCFALTGVIGCSSHVGILRLAAGKVANYFTSPAPGQENCTWLIIASEPDEVVRLDFEDVDVQNDPQCSLGGISIYDGSTFNTKRLGVTCGDIRAAYESSGRYMLISLRKNATLKGFRAKYYMFSNNIATSNVASIVGGIIGAMIVLSLGTTIYCTLKTHHMIPSILPEKPNRRQSSSKTINKEQVTGRNLPKVSVVVASSDYVRPPMYPAALQASASHLAGDYQTNPYNDLDSPSKSYSNFQANKNFTSTRSILSPGGYISTQTSSFENFD